MIEISDRCESIATKPELLEKLSVVLLRKITMSEPDEVKYFFDIALRKVRTLSLILLIVKF